MINSSINNSPKDKTPSTESALLNIELIYALPEEQELIYIQVKPETTVEQAIQQSNILKKYPEINLEQSQVGIFSQKVQLNVTLRDGDRIEIYRPLTADPKEARKKKAISQKDKKRSEGKT